MLRPRIIHVVGIDDVGLTGFDTRGQDANPKAPRGDLLHQRAILGRHQRPFLIRFHSAHEGIGDQHALMKIERLAIRITAGWAAHFQKFFDFRVIHRQVASRRATAERALGNRQRQAIHHANEGNDARGLAVTADLFANAAQIPPIGPDATALGCQPHILIPKPDNAIKAVRGFVQEAGNRQAASRATIGQNRCGRHEPKPRDIVIDSLRMRRIIAISGCDSCKQILIGFAGQQITIIKCSFAEIGQQRIARAINAYLAMAFKLNCVEHG